MPAFQLIKIKLIKSFLAEFTFRSTFYCVGTPSLVCRSFWKYMFFFYVCRLQQSQSSPLLTEYFPFYLLYSTSRTSQPGEFKV